MEAELGDSAIRGDVLVLLSDRLVQAVDLDLAGRAREVVRQDRAAAMRVERLHERGRETAGRAEAGAGGDVGERGDLDLRRAEVEHPDGLADDRMLDVVGTLDVFELRVLEEDAADERPHHGDVDVLVDRRGDEEAAVLAVVRAEVGAAAAERDPQRATGDDHARDPS